MYSRSSKTGYFVIEGLNSFATVYYFYYFYFYMQKQFGYENKANLLLAALNGAVYAAFSWWGGRYGERQGYFKALKLGFAIMMAALLAGSQLQTASGQILVMLVTVVGMSFTWPTLEALVSSGETRTGVQHMVGVYNVVWAATGAVGYFIGGAMLETFGLRSLFYVPLAIHGIQLVLTVWLEGYARRSLARGGLPGGVSSAAEPHPHSALHANCFLRMSWLANPFAYIAINTLIAVIPGVATRLELSTMMAGFCCSVWCFARVAAFWLLWRWTGWHYRFRWLLLSFAALIGSFAVILMVPNLAVLIGAQIGFGLAIGLIYYSSLFYSMDCSDTKGEHGGIHETVIGLGNFAGPVLGAASIHFLPQYTNSGAIAVSILLVCGMGALGWIWKSGRG